MTPVRTADKADRGSMFIDAMVAVAVMALVLAVGYRAIGESALRVRAANASAQAMLIARSRMASIGADVPLTAGVTQGNDNGFDWRITVSPQPAPASATGDLWRTQVTVERGGTRLAALESLRLGPGS